MKHVRRAKIPLL